MKYNYVLDVLVAVVGRYVGMDLVHTQPTSR